MTLITLTTQRPVRIVNEGDNPGVIINRDLVNLVLYGETPAFDPLNDPSIIDPLTYAAYDGTTDIWAMAQTGLPTVDISEGRDNWAPSPAQTAQQISALGLMKDTTGQSILTSSNAVGTNTGSIVTNTTGAAKDSSLTTINGTLGTPAQDSIRTAIPTNISTTGVPVINNNLSVSNQSGTVITAGSTTTFFTAASVTRPTFEVILNAKASSSTDTSPFVELDLTWIDSSSGVTVTIDTYYFVSMTASGSGYAYHGIGVSHGDQLTAAIKNWGSSSVTVNLTVLQNGKPNPISNELWTLINPTANSPNNFVLFGGNNPGANMLLNSNFTVAASATQSRLVTTYYGRQINFTAHTGAGTGTLQIKISYAAPVVTALGLNSSIVNMIQSDGNGNIFRQIQCPNFPIQVDCLNQDTATRTIDLDVTGA